MSKILQSICAGCSLPTTHTLAYILALLSSNHFLYSCLYRLLQFRLHKLCVPNSFLQDVFDSMNQASYLHHIDLRFLLRVAGGSVVEGDVGALWALGGRTMITSSSS